MNSIYEWLEEACRPLRYKPDKEAAYRELKDHYEDHRSYLEAQGAYPGAAERQALAAMGDPSDTARMLSAAYHPVLTFLWRLSRGILIALGIALIIALIRWDPSQKDPVFYDPEERVLSGMTFYTNDKDTTKMVEGRCDSTVKMGDYSFTVTRALACQAQGWDALGNDVHFIVLVLRAKGPIQLDIPQTIRYYVTAQDDKGNFYSNALTYDAKPGRSREVQMNSGFKRFGSCYYSVYIDCADPDAEWIDLCYEHMGSSFSLRVWFDEGAAK